MIRRLFFSSYGLLLCVLLLPHTSAPLFDAWRAQNAYSTGDVAAAKQFYTGLLQNNYQDWQSLFNLGTIAFNEKAYEDAVGHFSKVLEFQPDHAQAKERLAAAKKALEQKKEQEKQQKDKQDQEEKDKKEKEDKEDKQQEQSKSEQEKKNSDQNQDESQKDHQKQQSKNEAQDKAQDSTKTDEQQKMKQQQDAAAKSSEKKTFDQNNSAQQQQEAQKKEAQQGATKSSQAAQDKKDAGGAQGAFTQAQQQLLKQIDALDKHGQQEYLKAMVGGQRGGATYEQGW